MTEKPMTEKPMSEKVEDVEPTAEIAEHLDAPEPLATPAPDYDPARRDAAGEILRGGEPG